MGLKMVKTRQPSLEYISPDQLLFDPENPRFSGGLQGKSQPDIQKAIFGPPHYASELVDSFLENGFITYEPLVAKRHDGKLIVIEGNRRLAAIKEIRADLNKYKERKSDLHKVPVIVFPDKEDGEQSNDARVYLGVRHLLGFREWPPLAKAEFLEKESKKTGGLEQVIKEVRLTRQQVRRFLIPYRLLKEAKVKLPEGKTFGYWAKLFKGPVSRSSCNWMLILTPWKS
jgi:ParB-like nuclease family protein